MPKRILVILALGLCLFTILVIYLLSGENQEKRRMTRNNKELYDNWEQSYDLDIKEAQGISLFNELLEYHTKKKSIVIDNVLDSARSNVENTSYFFIGENFELKTEEFDSLISDVEKGANLFVAYKAMTENVFSFFFEESGFMWDYSESKVLETENQKYKMYAIFQGDTVAIAWNFFPYSKIKFDSLSPVLDYYSLSSIDDFSILIDFMVGDGHIYLHSIPEVFQNYQLLTKNGYEYSEFVTNLIPENHQVKWLELAKTSSGGDSSDASSSSSSESGGGDDSYLQYIFKNKNLIIALLLALLGVILFLIFRTKRSKPLIPYHEKTSNQSLVFAETIKEIYLKQQTPYGLLQVMRKNFYTAVNKQFFVDISKKERAQELRLLTEKSGIKQESLEKLLSKFETRVQSAVDYKYLEEVSEMQHKFYNDTGIIKQRLKQKIEQKSLVFKRKIFMPIILIVLGISILLYGFYLLNDAKGIGITLWPIGIVITSFGVRLFSLPLLKVEAESLTFFVLFGKSQDVKTSDLTGVKNEHGTVSFTTFSKQVFHINMSELSFYDVNPFEQFILPLIHRSYDK